jgi:hypothetical protein
VTELAGIVATKKEPQIASRLNLDMLRPVSRAKRAACAQPRLPRGI